jgi:hypothetical protein
MIIDPQLASLLKWPVAVTLLWLGLMGMPQAAYPQALPDPTLTPGAVNAHVIAEPGAGAYLIDGVEYNLCAKDFRTKPFRKATKSVRIKTAVCRAYGIKSGCPGKAWELDDAVPVELGGDNIQSNLWPQPIKEARVKDHQVEDKFPKLVCAGKISLEDAQACLRTNWVKCQAKVRILESKQ